MRNRLLTCILIIVFSMNFVAGYAAGYEITGNFEEIVNAEFENNDITAIGEYGLSDGSNGSIICKKIN